MEDLKTETSSEAKRSQCFKYDILCVFAGTMNEKNNFVNVVIKNEGGGKNFNSVQRNDEIVVSHANSLTLREEGDAFQHTVKVESKEVLVYVDGQELKETKEDIKHSIAMLEKTEKKVIEDFLSLVGDLGQQEDLMI